MISWAPIKASQYQDFKMGWDSITKRSTENVFSFSAISAPLYHELNYFNTKYSQTILTSFVFRQIGAQEIFVTVLVGHFSNWCMAFNKALDAFF